MTEMASLLTGLLMAALWWHFKRRGRRLARAYTYLVILKRPGSTVESSNWVAQSIDLYAANQVKQHTRQHVDEVFNGSGAAMIAEAKAQGFLG